MPPETIEELLAPWVTLAEIVYHTWRSVIHDGGGRDVPKGELSGPRPRTFVLQTTPTSGWSLREMFRTLDTALDTARQPQLRELLEILVLAVRVDARTCMDLACDGRERRTPFTCEPFDTYPWIPRLHIHAYACPKLPATADFYKAFFDWTEETASEEFKQSKAALTELLVGRVEVPGRRFELKLDLKLRSRREVFETLWLAPMIQLLQGIDRQVFRVVHITLTIKHSTFKADELTELFQLIHGFHDEADVLIRLQLCQDKHFAVNLREWKPIFDLVARKSFTDSTVETEDSPKKNWDIEVACGGPGLDNNHESERSQSRMLTDTRLIAACYSALAHAGAHVTSIHLTNPLTDKTSEFRGPRDRTIRAEWLGYLMRGGVVDKLVLDEASLTHVDIDQISDLLLALDQNECFRLLWNRQWHRSLEKTKADGGPEYLHINDTECYLNDPSEVLGMMPQTTIVDDELDFGVLHSRYTDVFLVGYGQWSIPPSLADMVYKVPAREPETPYRLKSLTIRIPGDSDPKGRLVAAICNMVFLFSKDLAELTIHGPSVKLSLAFVALILDVCRKLRRLDLETLHLKPSDVKEAFRPYKRTYPLQELVLGIQLDEQSLGLQALSKCIVAFGFRLREFRIRVKAPHRPLDKARLHPVEKMLLACCKSCSIIEVSGLAVDYFRAMYRKTGDACFPELSTLVLNNAIWTKASWNGLLAGLSIPTSGLARSLRTLVVHSVDFTQAHDDQMADMLAKNHSLVNVSYVAQEADDANIADTNGAVTQRPKTPFGVRHKAAFISVIESSSLPGETFVIANIFEFAREYEVRRVIVS